MKLCIVLLSSISVMAMVAMYPLKLMVLGSGSSTTGYTGSAAYTLGIPVGVVYLSCVDIPASLSSTMMR